MNKLIIYFLILTCILVCPSNLKAQENSETDTIKTQIALKKSYGVIGLKYSNDWVYMGRSDSIKTPYFNTSVGYFHKSGIFVNTALYYLVAESSNRIDLIVTQVGYDYFNKKLSTGFAIIDYFYNDKSFNVQSEMSFYTNAYIGYDFQIVEAELNGALGIGYETDAFISIELNRTLFMFKNNLKLIPTLQLNWGTQQYYNEYYRSRNSSLNNLRGNGMMGNSQNMSVFIDESTKFQLLDYEFSLPMTYYLNKFRVLFKPTIAVPLNPSQVTVNDVTYTEDLKKVFFWSMGLMYKF